MEHPIDATTSHRDAVVAPLAAGSIGPISTHPVAETTKAFSEFDCNVPKLLASFATEIPSRWLPDSSDLGN